MNNQNFNSLKELQEYKNSLKITEDIFLEYLSKVYSNLLQREEEMISHSRSIKEPRHSLDSKQKDSFISSLKNSSYYNPIFKSKILPKNISLNNFLDFMDIQEFIAQRIFKYLNKSKSNKLNKNDFCQGLNSLYLGDVNNLIKFTFFLADFNRDGMIYKSDMKLILAYIPAATEFSQKLKIKQINSIINIFFQEKIDKNEQDVEKEINYEKYLKYVQDYINNENKINLKNNSELLNDYNNNAPFFYFISILSYLFKNCPFNPKNVEFFKYTKKKVKLKLLKNEGRSISQRKIMATSKKDLNFSSMAIFDKSSNKIDSSLIGLASIEPKKLNKFVIDAALSKIDKKNLFKTKKSSSQIAIRSNKKCPTLKGKLTKRPDNKKHDFIIAKDNKNGNGNILPTKSKIYQKILNKNVINGKKKLLSNNEENISTKNTSPMINVNQSPNLNMTSASPDIFKNNKNSFNSSHESNESSSKNNSTNNLALLNLKKKISSISIQKENDKTVPLSVGAKIKEDDKDLDDLGEFVLCEYSSEEDSPNKNKRNSKNEDNNETNSDELFLYKFDEDDFLNKLNKYYAKISGKEILFFNSETKSELCDLWYLYKSYISTSKEKINGTYYYAIIISFNNNKTNKLYFIDEKICLNFSKRIKNHIKNLDFEEYYEKLEKTGHGHFGKVYKCKNKLTGQIYAAKIINKHEIEEKDLDLIRQEKNYLHLIKHQNIITLKDYFEDKNFIYFVTEYYSGGDIITFLEKKQKENSKVTEKTAAKIIKKIAEGIKYLNFFGIIHRDIKPENIMFAEQNEIKSLKIIDLGVCQTISYEELASEPIGTNGYISPEIYLHHNYSFKIDIWSLGVILYLLITGGILPFDDEKMDSQTIGKKVIYLQQEYPEKYFGNKSKSLITLLDKMLEKNDNKRININELIKDSWFEILKK